MAGQYFRGPASTLHPHLLQGLVCPFEIVGLLLFCFLLLSLLKDCLLFPHLNFKLSLTVLVLFYCPVCRIMLFLQLLTHLSFGTPLLSVYYAQICKPI